MPSSPPELLFHCVRFRLGQVPAPVAGGAAGKRVSGPARPVLTRLLITLNVGVFLAELFVTEASESAARSTRSPRFLGSHRRRVNGVGQPVGHTMHNSKGVRLRVLGLPGLIHIRFNMPTPVLHPRQHGLERSARALATIYGVSALSGRSAH